MDNVIIWTLRRQKKNETFALSSFYSLIHLGNPIKLFFDWRKNETRDEFMQQRPEMERLTVSLEIKFCITRVANNTITTCDCTRVNYLRKRY